MKLDLCSISTRSGQYLNKKQLVLNCRLQRLATNCQTFLYHAPRQTGFCSLTGFLYYRERRRCIFCLPRVLYQLGLVRPYKKKKDRDGEIFGSLYLKYLVPSPSYSTINHLFSVQQRGIETHIALSGLAH